MKNLALYLLKVSYFYLEEENKLMLREYSELPDYMTVEELEEYFIKLLDYSMESKDINSESISEALYKLSDRQWHTYELMGDKNEKIH